MDGIRAMHDLLAADPALVVDDACRSATGWPSPSRGAERRDDVPALAPPDVRRAGGDPVRERDAPHLGRSRGRRGRRLDLRLDRARPRARVRSRARAPGSGTRPSSARSSAPTSCSTCCAGRWCSRIPRPARCCACRAAATRSSAATPGTTCTRTGTRSCACSSCTRRRPRPARRAPTRARGRTSSRPTGATATTRCSGTCPAPSPRGARCFEPAIVWRRSLGVLEGLYASTEHLTAGLLELNPGEISATHTHGGDEVVYALEGVLHVRAFGEDGNSVFELEPRRRGLHPARASRTSTAATAPPRCARSSASRRPTCRDARDRHRRRGHEDRRRAGRHRHAARCEARFERVTRPERDAAVVLDDCVGDGAAAGRRAERRADRHRRVRARRPRGPHAVGADARLARARRGGRVRARRPGGRRERRARRRGRRGALRRRPRRRASCST